MKKTINQTISIFTVTLLAFASLNAQDSAPAGKFEGKTKHKASGTALIEKAADGGFQVTLGDDFDFDGAPTPVVALGIDGYKKDTILGKLTKNKGKQTYSIPASIDASKYNEVWIWCTKFNVPLGLAKLSK